MTKRILLPVPDRDFDATEVAVPWRMLTRAGHEVVFATEHGAQPPAGDPKTLTGAMFGLFGASDEARGAYQALERALEFQRPISWETIVPSEYDGLWLPGGHAPGMRQYLGSQRLQMAVAEFWRLGRPVAAICHGVLVLARARDPESGKSPLAGVRTTCLPKYTEQSAYLATAWKLGRYYRTYDAHVEEEVRAALDDPDRQFERGPRVMDLRQVVAGREQDALVVQDGRYVSGRWPGDAAALARRFLELLGEPAVPPLFSDVRQICTVAEDFEATVQNLVEQLGIGPFRCWHFRPPKLHDTTYRGEPATYSMKLAITWLDDVQWEVITPVDGPTLYRDHLRDKGRGIQHLLMSTSVTFEQAIARLEERGHPFGQTAKLNADAQFGRVRLPPLPNRLAGPMALQFGYVDAEATLRSSIELTRYPLGFSERFSLRSGRPEFCIPDGNPRFEQGLPSRRVGSLVKVTIATRDLDGTVRAWIDLGGVRPWRLFEGTDGSRAAWGLVGSTIVELVEPQSGPYARLLDTRGEAVAAAGVLPGAEGFEKLARHCEAVGYARLLERPLVGDHPAILFGARKLIGTDLEVLAPGDPDPVTLFYRSKPARIITA
jgi:putative intracellular protease/amidase